MGQTLSEEVFIRAWVLSYMLQVTINVLCGRGFGHINTQTHTDWQTQTQTHTHGGHAEQCMQISDRSKKSLSFNDIWRFRLATFQIKFHLNFKSRDHKFTNITLNIRILQFSDFHIQNFKETSKNPTRPDPFLQGGAYRLEIIRVEKRVLRMILS